MTGRLTRGRVVVAVLVLGAVAFALSALTWASAEVPTVLAENSVAVSGGEAAPATQAAALAVLAAGLAVAIGGRWVTRVVAVALAGLGVLLGASAVGFLMEPRPRLEAAAAQVSGVREIAGEPALTPWPYATALLGLVVVAVAVLTLRVPTTATPGRRFERAGDAPAPSRRTAADDFGDARGRAMDDWDALGRGEDPSAADQR